MPKQPVVDGWNHNTHYHPLLLEAVPHPCRRALDVGCGLGTFSRKLAGVSTEVDALERDPTVVARARAMSTTPNVRFIEADFMTWPHEGEYDFVAMIASLHFLPFEEAAGKAARLLRPGGVFGVIGLHRYRSLVHGIARAAVAYPVRVYYLATRPEAEVGAPIRSPTLTLPEIRRRAADALPSAIIRRHVLWRYSLIWIKPA